MYAFKKDNYRLNHTNALNIEVGKKLITIPVHLAHFCKYTLDYCMITSNKIVPSEIKEKINSSMHNINRNHQITYPKRFQTE